MEQQHDTVSIAVGAVKASGLLGLTSTEISANTGVANNRITAALSRAHDFGCLRREKIYGNSARYRYFYIRDATRADYENESKKKASPVPAPVVSRAPALDRSVLVALNIPDRTPVYVSVSEARAVFDNLRALFEG